MKPRSDEEGMARLRERVEGRYLVSLKHLQSEPKNGAEAYNHAQFDLTNGLTFGAIYQDLDKALPFIVSSRHCFELCNTWGWQSEDDDKLPARSDWRMEVSRGLFVTSMFVGPEGDLASLATAGNQAADVFAVENRETLLRELAEEILDLGNVTAYVIHLLAMTVVFETLAGQPAPWPLEGALAMPVAPPLEELHASLVGLASDEPSEVGRERFRDAYSEGIHWSTYHQGFGGFRLVEVFMLSLVREQGDPRAGLVRMLL